VAVSIDDVAQRAGVSRGTVSHVLNGNERARIAPATQERVRKAATDLGYFPNRIARSLGRRRTDTIGLVIPGLQNPFYVHLLESVERIAAEAGYQVLLDAAPSQSSAARPPKLRGWPVDGALIWGEEIYTVGHYADFQSNTIPIVCLGGETRADDRDWVVFDVYGGVRTALEYLVQERGARRIGFVYPYSWVVRHPDEPRWHAYREMCEAHPEIVMQLLPTAQPEETRHAGLEMGLSLAAMTPAERPQAVLCFNDVVAQGVLFGLRRAGLRVPEDVAVVGVDGIDEGQHLDVPLTTVVLPFDALCREALQLLLRRIGEGRDAVPQRVTVPTYFRRGGTA
jgi:DNA-binding LacI/PurR family transcriptional regulator